MQTNLRAQMKVAQENSRLTACNDENDEDNEEEAEHVVRLMRPARTHLS